MLTTLEAHVKRELGIGVPLAAPAKEEIAATSDEASPAAKKK